MGILTRPLLRPQQRWDLEDFNTALSALRADSHFQMQRFWSDKSYILQGFTISNGYIGQPTAEVSLTSATVINANNTGDVSWWTAPVSPTPITLPTGVGGLQGGRNYVELEIYSQDGTPLQRAFWDPSANSGQGLEFTQEVNTVTEMFIRARVNQSGFNTGNPNRIPLAIIDLDGSLNIRGIRDRRELFYRMATSTDIDAGFTWGSRTEPDTTLIFNVSAGTPFLADETITFSSGATAVVTLSGTNNIKAFDFSTDNFHPGDLVSGSTSGATATLQSFYESFTGADKDIKNLKDVITALQNEIRTVKGTRFWYEAGSTGSLPSVINYINSIVAPVSTGARFSWDGTSIKLTDNQTSGQATSDVIAAIRIPGFTSDLLLTREDGFGGSAAIAIPNQCILFVNLPAAGSSRTYSEAGSNPDNFQVVPIGSFVPTDSNYILAYREGTKLIVTGLGELKPGEDADIGGGTSKELLAFIGAADETSTNPQYTATPSGDFSNEFTTADSLTQAISITTANLNDVGEAVLKGYDEHLAIAAPVSIGGILTLPLDSRTAGTPQQIYVVNRGTLWVFLNGQPLSAGYDYNEVGSSGSQSSTIEMLQALVVGDDVQFRIVNPQYFGTGAINQPYFVNYIIGQNGSDIPVGDIYNLATDRLQIWRNGLCMLKSNSVGALIERYSENSTNSIGLSQAANNSEIFAMVNHVAPNPSVSLITGVTGTVLTIPTYVIGNGALRVYRNGVLLSTKNTAPTDLKYVETSTTSITLSMAATITDVFKVYKSGATPTFRGAVTGVTATVITVPGTYAMGDQKLLVFRNGLLINNSTTLGSTADRYQETTTTTITLGVVTVSTDLIEFIYV